MNSRIATVTAAGGQRYFAARLAAAAWLIDQAPPADATQLADLNLPGELPDPTTSRRAWQTLLTLPVNDQRTRVAALRAAELACDGRDLMEILVGPDGSP